jgi:hypothetical protein
MTVAFVLGNGVSRQGIDLHALKKHGQIYGCNALYRDFEPDVLIAADRTISEHIQHSGYAKTHKFYTRKPLEGSGALRIPERYWGYSSGQIALGLACIDRHTPIFLLGFDLGALAERFNNVYASTEFYKRHSDRPTYTGNWIRQTVQIARDYPECQIVRVTGTSSAIVAEFKPVPNLSHLDIEAFTKKFGL